MFVGIIYSNATQDKNDFNFFMLTNFVFYAIISFGMPFLLEIEVIREILSTHIKYIPVQPLNLIPFADFIKISILMFFVAFFSIAGFLLLAIAMRKGSHSIAWGIMQSAIIMPFLAGWLIFGDKVNLISIVGMILVIISLSALFFNCIFPCMIAVMT
jgi:multidrug transporter EmrE-like cation transporter